LPERTEWDNIQALWADLSLFARQNREHQFLCADDPLNQMFGWVAFRSDPQDERAKYWLIPVITFKVTFRRGFDPTTAQERREHLERLVAHARSLPFGQTWYDRLGVIL
jgi:hypothetical protein